MLTNMDEEVFLHLLQAILADARQLCNLQHATSFANTQAQDTNSTSLADDAASHDVSSNAADPFLHCKLLAQPHQLRQMAASVPKQH